MPGPSTAAGARTHRAAQLRWATASELLGVMHASPGITRTKAREELALGSGAAADLIERLRAAHLLAERRARPAGPGRPTTVLTAHPAGPLVLVVDLRSAGWRVVLGDLAGNTRDVAAGVFPGQGHPSLDQDVLPGIASAVETAVRSASGRVRAVVAVVAGTVSGTRVLQFATRGWNTRTDLSVLTAGLPDDLRVPLIAGNDATLGGVAEARCGAARGASVALHLLVAVGVGGVLLLDGRPVTGARGAGGEYGHLPLGDPSLRCPCGAYGCWDLMVDGRALARLRGDAEPADPYTYARGLLDARIGGGQAGPTDRHAIEVTVRALGRGIGALVNLHDPEVVTLAGLGPRLRVADPEAFDRGYREGLMVFHRADPPPVLDATFGEGGPVRGALGLGFDEVTSPAGLSDWEERRAGRASAAAPA